MEEIIKKAVEGGYVEYYHYHNTNDNTDYHNRILLDPLFWQALGKGLGNKDEMRCKNPDGSGTSNPNCDNPQCEYAGYKNPRRMYESFMEFNWTSKNIDRFFEDLLNN